MFIDYECITFHACLSEFKQNNSDANYQIKNSFH